MDPILFLVIPIIIISIILHEVAHGWSALFLGDRTALNAGRLTINPLSHLDPIGSVLLPLLTAVSTGFVLGYAKPVPYEPRNLRPVTALGKNWSEALVAFSGPATNFVLAVIFAVIYHIMSGPAISSTPLVLQGLQLVVLLNIFLGLLNLIPVPPLDGSKIVFTFLRYDMRRFLERYQMILIIVALLVVISTPVLEIPSRFIFDLLI